MGGSQISLLALFSRTKRTKIFQICFEARRYILRDVLLISKGASESLFDGALVFALFRGHLNFAICKDVLLIKYSYQVHRM